MIGLGTLVNAAAIITGGLTGLIFRKFLQKRYQGAITLLARVVAPIMTQRAVGNLTLSGQCVDFVRGCKPDCDAVIYSIRKPLHNAVLFQIAEAKIGNQQGKEQQKRCADHQRQQGKTKGG